MGSNLGDRRDNLARAISALASLGRIERVSSVYSSEPVGVKDQPRFLNLVVRLRTALDPHALLAEAKAIERRLGRRAGPRHGPRPIDVDILLYDDAVVRTRRLVIPHRALMERAFVLRPLVEIAPALRHPVTGERFAHRLTRGGFEQTRRLRGRVGKGGSEEGLGRGKGREG